MLLKTALQRLAEDDPSLDRDPLDADELGSYSVRLYSGKDPEFPFDDFVSGVLRERPDGFIEKVVLADIDGDSRPDIVVIFRCEDSGRYLSAEAFSADKKGLHLRATVTDLASNADAVKALKMKKRSKT